MCVYDEMDNGDDANGYRADVWWVGFGCIEDELGTPDPIRCITLL